MTAKELRELRAKIAARIGALNAIMQEAGEFTADQQAEWDKLDLDYKAASRRIDIAERAETIRAEQSAPIGDPRVGRDDYDGRAAARPQGAAPPEEYRALAIQAWFRCHASDDRVRRLESRHLEACEALDFDPRCEELVIRLYDTPGVQVLQDAFCDGPRQGAAQRARSLTRSHDFRATALSGTGVVPGGALMAPETMAAEVEIATLQFGGLLMAADVLRTDGRERFRWPMAKDTSNKGRRLGESGATSTTTTNPPTFSEMYLDAYKYTSDEILTPYELLTGTPFDLPAILGRMMGERIGRKFADDSTNGTGANQPKGVITAAIAAGVVAAANQTSIIWQDLETLVTAVDPSYRTGAAFMFHDTMRAALKNLLDGIGRPLWQDGPNGAEPALLKGYPWYINQSMQNVSGGIVHGYNTILFGQLKKVKVRQVKELRIYRLIERYRENDQDAFLAFQEMDSNVLDAGNGPIKVLQH